MMSVLQEAVKHRAEAKPSPEVAHTHPSAPSPPKDGSSPRTGCSERYIAIPAGNVPAGSEKTKTRENVSSICRTLDGHEHRFARQRLPLAVESREEIQPVPKGQPSCPSRNEAGEQLVGTNRRLNRRRNLLALPRSLRGPRRQRRDRDTTQVANKKLPADAGMEPDPHHETEEEPHTNLNGVQRVRSCFIERRNTVLFCSMPGNGVPRNKASPRITSPTKSQLSP